MLTNSEKINITDLVLKRNIFSKSPTSSSLLRYLVKASINGTEIKESIIGLEFLGSKYTPETGNARVRVTVYNLRKKLQRYYETEGRMDDWRIVILKGQYKTHFEKNTHRSSPIVANKYIIAFLAISLMASVSFHIVNSFFPLKPKIFKPFFKNNQSTTLYIGDAFGVMGTTATGNYGWNRDYTINSINEFYAFCDSNPNLRNNLTPSPYHYLTGMGPHSTKELTQLFNTFNSNFKIRFTSNSGFSDIQEGNSIYVGPIKTNNKFIHFFNEANKDFHLNTEVLRFSNPTTKTNKEFNFLTSGTESEYAIVSRIAGPDNTEQFLFFSDHDIGVLATVEYFSNLDSLKAFDKKYLQESSYFTAIFKAKGKNRTNMSLEIIMVANLH